jgi:hypothetical protein
MAGKVIEVLRGAVTGASPRPWLSAAYLVTIGPGENTGEDTGDTAR